MTDRSRPDAGIAGCIEIETRETPRGPKMGSPAVDPGTALRMLGSMKRVLVGNYGWTAILTALALGCGAAETDEGSSSTSQQRAGLGAGAPGAICNSGTGSGGYGGTASLLTEAEAWPIAKVSPGDTTTLILSNTYSGGKAVRLVANAPDDYVIFGQVDCTGLSPVPAPTWTVRLRVMKSPVAGIVELSTSGLLNDTYTPIGTVDLYSPTTGLQTVVFGSYQFPTNTPYFKLRVVAKNPASTGYNALVDEMILTH